MEHQRNLWRDLAERQSDQRVYRAFAWLGLRWDAGDFADDAACHDVMENDLIYARLDFLRWLIAHGLLTR